MILHIYYGAVLALMLATIAFCLSVIALELARGLSTHADIHKVGGMYFWRIGRLGGSIYLAKGY